MFVSRENACVLIFKILIEERRSNEAIYNVYNVSLKCKCSPQRIKTCSLYIPYPEVYVSNFRNAFCEADFQGELVRVRKGERAN